MYSFYSQIIDILTTPPGNLTYHLVLAFAAAGALQGALLHWRQSEFPQGRRMVIGLGLLLVGRAILFVGAGLVWQGLTPPQTLLPILDRTITILGIILIIWLWCFPEPLQVADMASILLGFVALAIAIFSYVWGLTQTSGVPSNAVWFNSLWEGAALFILILGIALILIRRPNGWVYGFVMLGVMTCGHVFQFFFPSAASDFPGIVRLAQIAAYPLLFTLPQRFVPTESSSTPVSSPQHASYVHKRQQYNLDPALLDDIVSISPEVPLADLQLTVTKLASQIMLADLCLLISPPDEMGTIEIICGYDLIREEFLSGLSLPGDQLPLLSTAIQREQSLRLPASSTSQDFRNLSKLLRLGRIGHLLAAPCIFSHVEQKTGLILLSPYSNRSWGKVDQKYLSRFTEVIQKALSRNSETPKLREQLEQARQIIISAKADLEEAKLYGQALQTKLDISQEEIKTLQEVSQEIERLQQKQTETYETIANLEVDKKQLEEQLEEFNEQASIASDEQLQRELQLALEEIARLKNILVESDQKIGQIKTQSKIEKGILSDAQMESISKLAQELRQPLVSMVGYTDILLGESVGILGSLQKQFLDRIKASAERIGGLLDTVLEKAAINIEELTLAPSAVDLSDAIDYAITEVSEHIWKKRISMRVDLADNLPKLHTDEDSLRQILINLLKNASDVTPAEGEIFIRARLYDEYSEQSFAFIQVADQGGGISVEDLPRVFSQLYNNNTNIKGIGGQGIELSVVKALVETQQGRIWVDSQEGVGAAFSLLLPLADDERDA
ncbi:MAG: hypothetical protein DRI56_01025 [Chloroflexota bacterium]|nr:MAG: hypothetical protein DRI56_01025 [Chloroflexota bacterium]